LISGNKFDRELAYGILRLTLGVNMLLHGLVRLPHLDSFASELIQQFAATPLPALVVRLFALTLPFAETLAGLLLILGLWTRYTLVGGGLLIVALVFGTALRSDWETLGIQMLYAAIYYLLLKDRAHNRFSIDHLCRRNSSPLHEETE
jgi:thiosulfate dehydrogenase [quinone] large subunit